MSPAIRLLLMIVLCPAMLPAQEDASLTFTSLDAVDDDFAFQGEFAGWQRPTGSLRSTQRIGLQVIAQGDGDFFGVKYLGGLPGDGWASGSRYRLEGKRRGQRLRLQGDVYDVVIHPQNAEVVNHDGQLIGRLERVQRRSPTLGAQAPAGAQVLFDGESVDEFVNGRMTPEGGLMIGADTRNAWNNFRLHGEFLLPHMPRARGQARANSGFYLQQRYEVQVLDSFGLEGIENECGSLYKTKRPDVNMCLPPLTWQTYDIDFAAPKFDAAGKKIGLMRISIWHNGVPIHHQAAIGNKTGAGQAEAPQPLPIRFQDHGNPVVFRNLWIIDTEEPAARDIDWLRLPLKAAPVPVGSGGLEPRFGL